MSIDFDGLALRLHELFAVGGRIHLLQQPDGQYCAVRRRLSVGRIRKMLESQESIAAFQFCGGVTRWVCLDFDLHRDYMSGSGVKPDLTPVLEVTQQCSRHLREAGLKHLVEYSGNRGFHVWILLSQKVNRAEAYRLLEAILTRCKLEGDLQPVKIDRYPKSPTSRSARGQGVKLPLSKHVKSGGYAYLLNDVDRFNLGEHTHIEELDANFVVEQSKILGAEIVCHPDEAFRALGLRPPGPASQLLSPGYLRASLKLHGKEAPTLKEVLLCLRRCKCVDGLLKELEGGKKTDEDTRVVLVGLLARLASDTHPSLGLDLLNEFFATLPDYDRVRTEEKLRDLSRLRPPTCEQLRNRLPQFNCDCDRETDESTSPVQYLSDLGVEIIEVNPFDLGFTEAHAVRDAQQRYTQENDEVSLYWTERELENLGDVELQELCVPADSRFALATRYHDFQRIEKGDNTRRLVALSARDKIRTTAATLILNDLMYQGFSGNSYGYKIVPQFVGGRIFHHWLKQWKNFTSHLGELIYAPEYADWGLLKIDVKSFYDNIDLERLRLKLHDGPTPSLRRHYRALDPILLSKYRRIINELVDTCRLICGSGRGVPQGPAFARFLAEAYLMDFDLVVEGLSQVAPDHYARYVDDIFVIVPPNANLVEIEADLLQHLGTLGLRHNPSKHFRGRVSDYRGAFAEYWQDTKYFIDQVSRRYESVPAGEVRRAARELYSLVDGGDGAELNREHLSFLYTHLQRDQGMVALRRRIEDYVLGLQEGRGSLFNNFFRHFLTAWRESDYEVNPKLATLDGLRKECFLNLLLAALAESPVEDDIALERIRGVVDGLVDNSGSELEKELSAALRLHDVRIAGPKALANITPSTLVSLAAHDFPKSIPEDVEVEMRKALLELELVPFVNTLTDILFNQAQLRPDFLGELLNDFRNKAMDAIREADEAHRHLEFLDPSLRGPTGELRDRYYQLCCLSSLSEPAPAEPKDVLDTIWHSLLRACNEFSDPPLFTSRWVTKLESLPMDDTLANIVLTQGIGDVVPGRKDEHGVFREFHQQLALDQMGIAVDGTQGTHSHVKPDVGDKVRDAVRASPERWPLLNWVFNKDPRPVYAPDRNECLANIATNGITVLRSGVDVLVRRRRDCAPGTPYNYLVNYQTCEDQLQNERFVCETFQTVVDGYISVEDFLARSTGLLDFIDAALKLRDGAVEFAEKHRPLGSEHMPNIFATGASVREMDCFPRLPQLVLGGKLIVPRGTAFDHRDNSLASFDEALYSKITQCEHTLLTSTDHIADVSAEQLDARLLAPFGNASKKLDFLADLCKRWNEISSSKRLDAFEIELCKADAVRQSIEAAPSPQLAPSEAYFTRYLGLRKEASRHFEYQLLLSPNDTTNLSTIVGVYATVSESIANFCQSVEFSIADLGIKGLLDADIQRLIVKLSKFAFDGVEPPDPNDFSRGTIFIDRDRGGLYLNGEKIQGSDPSEDEMTRCQVLELAFLDRDFQRLNAGRHQTLENAGDRVYSTQWQDKLLFVVVPRAVYKAATVVDQRTKELSTIRAAEATPQRSLWCYVNRSCEATKLQSLQEFEPAVQVVSANHPEMEKADAQQHLLNWLLNMPEPTRHLLTRVIAAHEPIRADHEEEFVEALRRLKSETIVFSLTTSDDVGGWHRLLIRKDAELARHLIRRAQNVEDAIGQAAENGGGYEIALVTDLVVSGGQILKGLKKHYLAESVDLELMARFHYFSIQDRDRFRECIGKCGRLRIITARYAENGAQRLLGTDGLPTLLGIPQACISVEGEAIGFDRCFLFGPGLDSVDQVAFKTLIQDMAFVKSTFRFYNERSINPYEYSVSDRITQGRARIDRTNLVTRRGSTPLWSAMIFRLPLCEGYAPLFKYVGEHDEPNS